MINPHMNNLRTAFIFGKKINTELWYEKNMQNIQAWKVFATGRFMIGLKHNYIYIVFGDYFIFKTQIIINFIYIMYSR